MTVITLAVLTTNHWASLSTQTAKTSHSIAATAFKPMLGHTSLIYPSTPKLSTIFVPEAAIACFPYVLSLKSFGHGVPFRALSFCPICLAYNCHPWVAWCSQEHQQLADVSIEAAQAHPDGSVLFRPIHPLIDEQLIIDAISLKIAPALAFLCNSYALVLSIWLFDAVFQFSQQRLLAFERLVQVARFVEASIRDLSRCQRLTWIEDIWTKMGISSAADLLRTAKYP